MKNLFLTLVLTFIFSNSACAHEKITPQTAAFFKGTDTAPAKVVSEFHSSLKNKNKKSILNNLDKSVLIYEGGGVERSLEEYASHHLISDLAFMSQMKVDLIEHQVEVYGDLAVSSARSILEGEYKGKKIKKTNMETIVLKKNKNTWKIIKIHWS